MSVSKTFVSWLGLLFAAGLGCGALFIGCYALQTWSHLNTRERTRFALPDGIHELEHSRLGTHPMLAEYSRDITFFTKGKPGRTTPLATDTCGGYPINCYYIDTPNGKFLRMDDAVSEHFLDLTTEKAYLVIRVQGSAYIGELTDENSSSGWTMSDNNPATLSVTVNGKPAIPITSLTQHAPEQYLGRIDGNLGRLRFIPAVEANEIAIHHLSEL